MQHRHPVIEAALVQRGRLVIQRLEETVVDFRTQRYACCRNKPAQNPALVDSSGRIIGHDYVLSVSCVSAQASAVIWVSDRKSVGSGKRVSVRVDLGGCRSNKKKT